MTRLALVPAAMLSMAIVGGVAGGLIALGGEQTPRPAPVRDQEIRSVSEVEPASPSPQATAQPSEAPTSAPSVRPKPKPQEIPELVYQGGPQTTAPRPSSTPEPVKVKPAPEVEPAPATPKPIATPAPTPAPVPCQIYDRGICQEGTP